MIEKLNEFPDADGYSSRNLARMRKLYITYGDLSNLPLAVANFPWMHNCILMEKVKNKTNTFGMLKNVGKMVGVRLFPIIKLIWRKRGYVK